MGARPATPTKINEASVTYPDWIYHNRNVVKCLWAGLKEWRAVATCCEEIARSFMDVLCLAAVIDWIRH